MKKLLIIMMSETLFLFVLSAQIKVSNIGYVGIGSDTPSEQFQVFKPATVNGNNVIAKFDRRDLATGGSGIIRVADGTSIADLQINSGYSNAGQQYGSTFYDFNIVNKSPDPNYGSINLITNNTRRIIIKSNGYVGIGSWDDVTDQFQVSKQSTANGNDIIANFKRGNLFTGGSGIVRIAEITSNSVAELQINSGYSNVGQQYGSTFYDFNVVNKSPDPNYGSINFVTNNSMRMIISPNGYVGIGKYPSHALDVNGEVWANNLKLTSDIRLKRNVNNLMGGLDLIMQLRPVTYEKKMTIDATIEGDYYKEIGFIAQEVQSIIPELVTESSDERKFLSINYISIIPVLTKAIQEQQRTIVTLQNQIEDLSVKLEEILNNK